MRRRFPAFALVTSLSFGGAIALAQEAGPKPIASVLQIMHMMTIPFSDVIFMAASEPPTTDAAWAALRPTALSLAEAGNLLMIGTRARDKGEWMKMARHQVDAAEAVVKAIDAKNADALSTASDTLYATCETCHKRYQMQSRPAAN